MAPNSLSTIAVLLNFTSQPLQQASSRTLTPSSALFALKHCGASLAVLCAREPRCLLALFLTPGLLSGLANFRTALLLHGRTPQQHRSPPQVESHASFGAPEVAMEGAKDVGVIDTTAAAAAAEETSEEQHRGVHDREGGPEAGGGGGGGGDVRILARDCLKVYERVCER